MADKKKQELTCTECGSSVDQDTPLILKTGCATKSPAYACSKCGRMHWPDGDTVVNRGGAAAYLEGRAIVMKKDGAEVARF